ncbi:MAG: hypothetical protein ACI8RZ_006495 [Myxococcota bacterium]|jgi:hypothetical protein
MFRWFLAFSWRVMKFWSLWMGLSFAFLLTMSLDSSGVRLGTGVLIRTALFLTTAFLLFSEWSLLNRSILAMEASLKEAKIPVPGRWEQRTHSCLALILVSPFLGMFHFFVAMLKDTHLSGEELVWTLLLRTFVWTILSLLVLTLAIGGFSRLRFRAALRVVPKESRPNLRPVLPWVMGAWGACALFLAFMGPPSLRTMAVASEVAIRAVAFSPRQAPRGGKTELLLELGEDDTILDVILVLFVHGAQIEPAFPGHAWEADLKDTWVLTVDTGSAYGLMDALRQDRENVDHIELNATVTAEPASAGGGCSSGYRLMPVDDPLASGQWELQHIGAENALRGLKYLSPTHPAVVAVIDTGINTTHADLRQAAARSPISDDRSGHGTAVAGLIAATGDNGVGMASLNLGGRFVKVRSYPALAELRPDALDIADAILDATDDGVDVINMSFGGSGVAPHAVYVAINRALSEGVILVAAAGNRAGGDARDQWPANISGVIAVGATNQSGQLSSFSSSVSGVSRGIWAPGEGVCTVQGDGYGRMSGTSMAAPIVSGVIATLRSVCPRLTAAGAYSMIYDGGRLNAEQAFVRAALGDCP